jgi:hypothetical protein
VQATIQRLGLTPRELLEAPAPDAPPPSGPREGS